MTIRTIATAVGIVLLLANPGWAQSDTTTTTTTTGSFDSLSPGNQKIANALFAAQKTTGTTLTPLTKNQIADLKGTEGWGKVFKEMKADGLLEAKNLGQVVSGYQHTLHTSTTSAAGRTASTATTGSTRSTTHAATRTGGSFSSAGITNGRGFAAGSFGRGGGVAVSTMGGGFGHGGMGGGGFGGGMSGGGFGGSGHGGGHGR